MAKRFEMRALTADDYGAVKQLWQAAGLSYKPAGRDSPDSFAKTVAEQPDLCLGTFFKGQLVGVCMGSDDGRKGWLNRLAVAPEHQRRGIATALVIEVQAALEARGRKVTGLLVEAQNAASVQFFQAIGYTLHQDIAYLSKRESPES